LDVAGALHFYEALLATLAIVVWHFYSVIFDPEVYPLDPAWLTGYSLRKGNRQLHMHDHDAHGHHAGAHPAAQPARHAEPPKAVSSPSSAPRAEKETREAGDNDA
jgi:hypothetical protein